MSKLNPEKLSVEYREGVTATEPIIPRRYTLTHSDITAELFLTIGLSYAYDKTTAMRDEVLGEWIKTSEKYCFCAYLYVDGQFGPGVSAIRDAVFRRELPLALEAIRYGDKEFFNVHFEFDNYPIIVYFMSASPQYNKIENWGTFSDYDITSALSLSQANPLPENTYLLDMKIGDVTGDGVLDKVSLYGNKPDGPTGVFADNITVVIVDGHTHQTQTLTPAYNSGYNAKLFLGDFTNDKIEDIKVSIDSGGSGGYGYFYIYSFQNNHFEEIFNFDQYNEEYQYKADYADFYRFNVSNIVLNKLFVLDLSYKGYDYLSQFYNENGKLKEPTQGGVLALGALIPIVNDDNASVYDLLAFARIIGTTNSDTLGYIENLLTWDGNKFKSSRMVASIPGTHLIAPYPL